MTTAATPPAHAATGPGQPVPYTLTARAHTALGPATPAPVLDLQQVARHLDHQLRAHRPPALTDASALDVAALMVAEEAGELVGAYRRWAGKARRTGTRRELEHEIADVLIATALFARHAGTDLHAALTAKLAIIYTRGWHQDPPPPAPGTDTRPADWWTTGDVAAYLGVAPSTVRAYAARRQMPPPDRSIGRARVWHPQTICAWHRTRPRHSRAAHHQDGTR